MNFLKYCDVDNFIRQVLMEGARTACTLVYTEGGGCQQDLRCEHAHGSHRAVFEKGGGRSAWVFLSDHRAKDYSVVCEVYHEESRHLVRAVKHFQHNQFYDSGAT